MTREEIEKGFREDLANRWILNRWPPSVEQWVREATRLHGERMGKLLSESASCLEAEHGGHAICPHMEETLRDVQKERDALKAEVERLGALVDAAEVAISGAASQAQRIRELEAIYAASLNLIRRPGSLGPGNADAWKDFDNWAVEVRRLKEEGK